MSILAQFIFRMSFGMALAMALTNPRLVTSGYYRNHLYVLLGVNVLATMVALALPDRLALAPPLLASILSYVGAVLWLYEKPRAGIAALALLSAVSLWGAWDAADWQRATDIAGWAWSALDPLTSGLLLGVTLAAMFLGHWYLNTPTMVIAPLERLVWMLGGAVLLRALVEAGGIVLFHSAAGFTTEQWLFLALRWLFGIVGTLIMAVMTYKTLQIPNTQSATGILYVCVIATFLGELTSLLFWSQGVSAI